MKHLKTILAGVLLTSFVVLAAADTFVDRYSSLRAQWFNSGVYIHPPSVPVDTVNKETRSLSGSVSFDFPSATITCNNATAITVLGAQVNDPCFTSLPGSPAANFITTCYVSAADTVIVRGCPVGTAVDPALATYNVRVISNQ